MSMRTVFTVLAVALMIGAQVSEFPASITLQGGVAALLALAWRP